MTPATLERLSHDIEEIKIQLRRISHILEEEFALSEETKKDMREARKQPLSQYTDHKEVMREFA